MPVWLTPVMQLHLNPDDLGQRSDQLPPKWFLFQSFCCQLITQLFSSSNSQLSEAIYTLIQILCPSTIDALCRTHIILANLRAPGTTTGYSIPRGFLFDYITCPNYTVEILGWVCFTIATSCLPALFFTLAGGLQMLQWAIAKHKRLTRVCFLSYVHAIKLIGFLWTRYAAELMKSRRSDLGARNCCYLCLPCPILKIFQN